VENAVLKRQLFLQFSGLAFVTLGPTILLCVYSFVFMCLYSMFFFILHKCHIIVTQSGGPGGIKA